MRSCAIFSGRARDSVDVVSTYLIGWEVRLFAALFLDIFVFAVRTTPGARVTIAGHSTIVAVV